MTGLFLKGEATMTAVRETAERRSAARLETQGAIRVTGTNEYVQDISTTGVFIRTDSPQPVGTRLSLRFTVILDEMRTMEGDGEVVRVVFPGGMAPAGMGVKFHTMTEDTSDLIERLAGPR
jgi:uncharacterized protein (TIGR02266 family)